MYMPSSIDYIYEEELSQQTVTGTTSFTSVASTDPLVSGNKYAIFVNSQFGGDDTSFLFGIRTRANGSTLTGSTRIREMNSVVHEQSYSYSTVFVSDGSPVSIEIQTQDSSKTARVEASTILCLDLSELNEGLDYVFSEDLSPSYNTNTYSEVNKLEMQTTYQNEGEWLIVSHVETAINDISYSNFARMKFKQAISGNSTVMSQEGEDTSETTSEYIQTIVSVPSPSEAFISFETVLPSVVALETKDEYTTSSNNKYLSSRMIALNLSIFEYYKTSSDNSLVKITNPGNFEKILRIEDFSPPGSQVTVVFAYGSFEAASINRHIHSDITIDENESLPDYGDNVMHRSYDDDDILPTSVITLEKTLPSSSVDIEFRMKGYNTDAGISYSSLCAFSISLSEEEEESVKMEPSKVSRRWSNS
jgi:hypothetical protein